MAYRSSVSDNGTTGSTVILNKPTGVIDGDYLVAFLTLDRTSVTGAAPDGSWTLLGTQDQGSNARMYAWGKIASSEPSTYTFGVGGTWAIALLAYQEIDTTNPVNLFAKGNWGADTNPLTSNVTTTNDGCTIIAAFGADNTSNIGPNSAVSPAVMRVDNEQSTQDVLVFVEDFTQASAGNVQGSMTSTGATDWITMILALNPKVTLGPLQFLRPISTITVNSWRTDGGGTNLHTAIDEESFSDSDYIVSAQSPISTDTCEVKFSAGVEPADDSGHIIRYRYKKSETGGDSINLIVRLMQGTTVIKSWTHTDIDAVTTAEQTLTTGEASAITDYTDLRLRFEATKA